MNAITDMFRPILETALRHCSRVVVTYCYPRAGQGGWRGEFELECWDVEDRTTLENALQVALQGSSVGAMSTEGEITITPPEGPVQARRVVAAAVHTITMGLVRRLESEPRSPFAFSTRCDGSGAGLEVSRW